MTDDELLEMMESMMGDDYSEDVCGTYLAYAKQAIVSRMWPFDSEKDFDDVPEAFQPRAVQIAVYMFNKRGAEGETRHVENGTTHEWAAAGIPTSYLDGINPRVGVV